MASVAKSFTAVGDSNELPVKHGESMTYDVSGTFVGTVLVQQFVKGGWTILASLTAPGAATVRIDAGNKSSARVRVQCSAFTSGTIVTEIADVSPFVAPPLGAATVEVLFTETGAGTYTGAVVLPAGATLLDIIVNGVALWDAVTSAVLKVGDSDDDGYYTAVNLKATDLLAGESISFALAGGKAGAYIANAQVSPRYSATARTINGIVTSVGAGTAGRTRMVVLYVAPAQVTPELIRAVVTATKV